jgi:hypothetical protein
MHDRNGTPLQVGDRVSVELIIRDIYAGEDYCNVTAETALGRRPDGIKDYVTTNTGCVVLLERAPDADQVTPGVTDPVTVPDAPADDQAVAPPAAAA